MFDVALSDGDQLGGRALEDGTVEVYVNGILIGEADAGPFFAGNGGSIGLQFVSPVQPYALLDDFAGR